MHRAHDTPLVLASSSPRRRDLLAEAGVPFEVIPPETPEEKIPGEAPCDLARRLAREKALAVASRLETGSERTVLGADTLVVRDGEILGKPRDPEHAFALLRSLVGGPHVVVTGVAVVRTPGLRVLDLAVSSQVHLRAADDEEIRAYVATGEPLDKAGAYAAQGLGRRFVEQIFGSESNVIGLPMEETLRALGEVGFRWQDKP